jgi:hypothetical protein
MSLIDRENLIKEFELEIKDAKRYAYKTPSQDNYTDNDYDAGYNDAFYDALTYAKTLIARSEEIDLSFL